MLGGARRSSAEERDRIERERREQEAAERARAEAVKGALAMLKDAASLADAAPRGAGAGRRAAGGKRRRRRALPLRGQEGDGENEGKITGISKLNLCLLPDCCCCCLSRSTEGVMHFFFHVKIKSRD